MRHEWRLSVSGLLSVTSILVSLGGGILANVVVDGFRSLPILTALAAAIAAVAAAVAVVRSRRLAIEPVQRRIFLIYAREDLAAARRLAEELKRHRFKPWLDVEEVAAGQVWQKAVLSALERSAVAVVLVSEHLTKKGFVQTELQFALDTLRDRAKDVSPIVPVRLDSSPVPQALSHVQWINLFEEGGMERLLSDLGRLTPVS